MLLNSQLSLCWLSDSIMKCSWELGVFKCFWSRKRDDHVSSPGPVSQFTTQVKMVDKVETTVEAIKKEAEMLQAMARQPREQLKCFSRRRRGATWSNTQPVPKDHPNIVKCHGVYFERRRRPSSVMLRICGSQGLLEQLQLVTKWRCFIGAGASCVSSWTSWMAVIWWKVCSGTSRCVACVVVVIAGVARE